MFDPFDKIAVPTTAGTYVIALYYDIDAAAPDYSDDGGFVYLGTARTISAQLGDAAHDVAALLRQHTAANDSLNDHEYRSAAALCRYLWLTRGLTGILEVTRSGDRYGTAEPSADATAPLDYTRGTVAAYDAWANGEVYGYTVVAPDGRDVASCWDFYADPDEPITADAPPGLATMVAQAREEIDHDVEARTAQANTIGSGFIGLI